jgi:hypothetical protein
MTHQLNGKRVAVLVADGFEQVEMTKLAVAEDGYRERGWHLGG